MCNRALQHLTSKYRNVLHLNIYLSQEFVDSDSGYFDELLFGNWQQLQTQGEDLPSGSDIKI